MKTIVQTLNFKHKYYHFLQSPIVGRYKKRSLEQYSQTTKTLMADKHEQRVMVREDAKLKSGQAGSETHDVLLPHCICRYI